MITILHPAYRAFGLATILVAASACDSTGPKPVHPVMFQLTTRANAAPPIGSAGSLQTTSFRLVVGAASLGGAGQFGCTDCQDNGGTEGQSPQQLINVPVGGGAVVVATEPVMAGHYAQAEISVEAPVGKTVAGTLGWQSGVSMEIAGRFNGTPFMIPLSLAGSFRETLTPPVDVTAGAPSAIPVTITLPVASWFVANGVNLDPSIPAQLIQIETNARASFQAPETKGGRSDGER